MRLVRFIDRLLWRALWRSAPSQRLHGIRTALFVRSDHRAFFFQRVAEALGLIVLHDPRAFARLQRHFTGILVYGTERYRDAHWNRNAGLCVVTERYLSDPQFASEALALVLVHEAMHAVLEAAGDTYEDGKRARIEVLCAMAELALARRLPGAFDLVRDTERRIEAWALGGELRWSDRVTAAEARDHAREVGAPRWVVALVDRLRRALFRRAA